MTITTAMLVSTRPNVRSVEPLNLAAAGPLLPPAKFSRADSTGLFIGVRTFPHDPLLTVPYAVDDAIDLAHIFSMDQRVGLVPPKRVVLALSGEPQKEESQERLRELRNAGATIADATSGDILHLMQEQAARAGSTGLLVVSIATHGFLRDADSYILGSTSVFGSPETSLRLATLLDTASRARRSLVFVDACRDRVGETSRGTTSDPTTAAPLLRKMGGIEGQVIFFAAAAGKYAYDDDVRRNGVFTKAVLDGLSCNASAPRGTVIVDTLHTYVEREVRQWAQKNRKPAVIPATQISMEGETRNMPLSQCWRSPIATIRVEVDGATVRTYDAETRPLWRKDFAEDVVRAEAADLDADGLQEVIVGVPGTLTAFDRDGTELWNRSGGEMSLSGFTVGDLFRKHTQQIIAIWNDSGESLSRLSIVGADGEQLAECEHAGRLRTVMIDRPTRLHHPKIVATSTDSLLVLKGKDLTPLWRMTLVSSRDRIEELRVLDFDHDSRRDISVGTKSGMTYFNFDGEIVGRKGDAQWRDASERKGRRTAERQASRGK